MDHCFTFRLPDVRKLLIAEADKGLTPRECQERDFLVFGSISRKNIYGTGQIPMI